jgi:hypothetical protein
LKHRIGLRVFIRERIVRHAVVIEEFVKVHSRDWRVRFVVPQV